jgi:hypothetical protein
MNFEWSTRQRESYASAVAFAQRELNSGADSPNAQFDRALWKKCATFGVLGWCMPREYGGSSMDVVTAIRMLEGIGYGCKDNALTLGLNGQIWSVQAPLVEFGNDEQKRRYLPGMCAGDIIAAHGMTEPDSGSDAFSLKSSAKKVDGGYVLNGHKCYVGLSYVADLVLVFASTNPDDGDWGISAFLVESGFDGYRALPPPPKMGLASNPLGEIVLEECFVPDANRLGPEGIGVSVFTHSMGWERSFIFSSHVGSMARQLDECVKYAGERKQFGTSIGKFQSVSNRIADMRLRLETSQLLLYKLAWMKDQNEAATLEAALAKLHLAESFVANSLDAIRIHGARGYMSDTGVHQDLRDAMAGVIYSGTSDIQRNIIARLMGL